MVFTLEAVFAKHGDALILHCGNPDKPRRVLIDGGPAGVYAGFLKPRFEELRQEQGLKKTDSLPFDMVMISHVDDDHINGVLALFEEQLAAHEAKRPLPYKIRRLWNNTFDDIIGNKGAGVLSKLAAAVATTPAIDDDSTAVVASVPQGRNLRRAAGILGMKKVNAPFKGLVMAPKQGVTVVDLKGGLSFSIIGPTLERVEDYQKRWDKDLEKILKKEKESAEVASMTDGSPFNLASIVVLAELGGKRMLLTGDARGDDIQKGLTTAGLYHQGGPPFHVDLLKVPHHGSDRNVTQEFFEHVTADHYVISGDGHHGNPKADMLRMLAAARGDQPYTLHFTVRKNAHETEVSEKRKACLAKLHGWVTRERPQNCQVRFRPDDANARSTVIDLEAPLAA